MNINEIAKLAGVSRATVSRFLNQGYVSDEKKLRIQHVIDQTGYKPSASAQTLRSKKTNTVGVIIPKINSDSISRMVSGISEILSSHGYQLLLACTDNDEQKELQFLDLFKDNHVDGIILLGTIFTPKHKVALDNLTVPIVILGQNVPGYSCVYHNDYLAAKDLTLSLVSSGKIFGYLSTTIKDIAVGKNRRHGFEDAMKEASITNYFIEECLFSRDSGYTKAKDLFSAHPSIDTLICATDTIALGAMMYLRNEGKIMPTEIQIAGMNDSSVSHVTSPQLTTVHFYYEEAGRESASSLINQMKEKEHSIHKTMQLDFKLMLSESTRISF